MNSHHAETRLTLADAVTLNGAQIEGLSINELDLSASERKATSRLWVHLTGAAGLRLETVAGNEALNDGELFVMLNMPARTFVDWFRREDWAFFELTRATGNDQWAYEALARARAMCAAVGALAVQVPLRLTSVD